MEKIINIFNEIKQTSSRLDKEQILNSNKDNEEFKYYLKFLLDPFIITGIGKKKLKKWMTDNTASHNHFQNFRDLCEYVKINNTGSDSVVDKVVAFIKEQPTNTKEFYEGIIRKDLKVGLQASTVNKVYGKGYINHFKIQLAKKYEDEVEKIQGKEFVLTEKLDGMRSLIFITNGIVKAFSRKGQTIIGLLDIENEAKNLPNGVYDGELVIANADNYKDRDVLQETLKITRKDGEKTGVIFHVFDYITLEDFNNGQSEYDYDIRRKFIEESITNEYEWIKVLPVLYRGKDHSVIPDILKELEEQGKEGLMLNTIEGKWKNKRTNELLKVKSMQTADLKVIGFVEGEGKYQNMLGKIVVDYKGFHLGCGSGFTDEQREYIWNNQNEYLGKIVEIQFFRESKNDNGGLSVSFPVFIRERFEKDEPSYY